ncbi:hypothetical protein ACX28W_32265, partial [Streptomyces sp. SD15]
MSEQIAARRNTVLVASATGLVAGMGLTGDIIFDVFGGTTARVVCGCAAVVAGGVAAYGAIRANRAAAGAASNVPQPLPPRQLPSVEPVVGCEAVLGGLLAMLRDVPAPGSRTLPVGAADSRSKLIVVHGTPGVGKTALALNAAHQVKNAYPDGQMYLNLHGDGEAPKSSGEALGVLPCEVGDAAGGWFACERGVSAVVIVGMQPCG